jgi:hypothetical protein
LLIWALVQPSEELSRAQASGSGLTRAKHLGKTDWQLIG